MKFNTLTWLLFAIGALVVYLGYQNQKNTGSILGGSGTVGVTSDTSGTINQFIDDLTNSEQALGISS